MLRDLGADVNEVVNVGEGASEPKWGALHYACFYENPVSRLCGWLVGL